MRAVAVVGAGEGGTLRQRVDLARQRALSLLPAGADVRAVEVRRVGRRGVGATAEAERGG